MRAAVAVLLRCVATVLAAVVAAGAADEIIFPNGVVTRARAGGGAGGGAACVHRASNRLGQCRPLPNCPSAVADRRRGSYPQLCGFPNGATSVPDACCPLQDLDSAATAPKPKPTPTPTPTPTPRPDAATPMTCDTFNKTYSGLAAPAGTAQRMCLQYQRDICSGRVDRSEYERKYGFGAYFVPVDWLEYPHMALLGYGERDSIEYSCGGSLISANYVLTAAHCRASSVSQVRWVLLGALNRTTSTGDNRTRQLIEVAEVIVHPEYTVLERYHDVALLRLAEPAVIADLDVRPACLHTDLDGDDDDLLGGLGVVTGWGAEAFGDDGSERLLKGNVTLRQLQECLGLDRDNRLPRGLDPRAHICAGGDGKNPTDACNGDSGGPLQFPALRVDPECMFRVAGVVSFGPPCGIGLPGVYAKVSTYVPWIERVVWGGRAAGDAGECVPNTGPGTAARRACERYLRRFCGKTSPGRVARPGLLQSERCHFQEDAGAAKEEGLQAAALKEFPHQVLLSYGQFPTKEQGCAGSLISPKYVLTAAHCAQLDCGGQVRRVLLGVRARDRVPRLEEDVEAVVVHPDYDPATRYNDIALVRLVRDVPASVLMRPACLHTEDDGPVLEATASGILTTGSWEFISGEARKLRVAVEDGVACRTRLGPGRDPRLPRGAADSQICTARRPRQPVVPGDSGGPLQVLHRVLDGLNVYRVVGVLSVPAPCGTDQPDVYTKVAPFVPWIESIVWPSPAV